MVEYVLDGLPVRNLSAKIGRPLITVWTWRSKILHHIKSFIDDKNLLSTLLYSDETFIKINLKGTKPKNMPRCSYKTKKASVAQRELVCIQTITDNTKRTVFHINGVARLNREILEMVLKPLLSENTTMVTDGDHTYRSFTLDYVIIHVQLISPDIKSRNGYKLGPINNLHSSFEYFLLKCRGVSIKRLEGIY